MYIGLGESGKMDKKKFDKIMEDWIVHEMDAVPDLEPSQEVYRKLEDKKKKTKFVLFSWPVRLAAAGIAAALIILVIVIKPPREVEPLMGLKKGTVPEVAEKQEAEDRMHVLEQPRGGKETEAKAEAAPKSEAEETEVKEKLQDVGKIETARLKKKVMEEAKQEGIAGQKYVPDRLSVKTRTVDIEEKAKEADKEMFARPTVVAARPRKEITEEKKKAEVQAKRGKVSAVAPASPNELMPMSIEFQYRLSGSDTLKKLSFDTPRDEFISLSSEDNYRLVLQFPSEQYVYVFQVSSDERAVRLFPNEEFNPAQNPLTAGNIHVIPLPPRWFYMDKVQGEVRLYVLTSAGPLHEWDDLDTVVSAGWLESIKEERDESGERISIRVFKFNIR